MDSNMKMTMMEYFDKQEIYDFSVRSKESEENAFQDFSYDPNIILGSKTFASGNDEYPSSSRKPHDFSPRDLRQDQYEDLIVKQKYSKNLNNFTDDNDSEDIEETEIIEIPDLKLDIPESPKNSKMERKNVPSKTQICKTTNETIEANKTPKSSSFELEEDITLATKCASPTAQYLESKKFHLEPEIFKDCLTDSDELRRQSMANEAQLHNPEYNKQEDEVEKERALKADQLKNYLKNLRISSKSDTFIRDLSEKSYELKEHEAHNENCSKSSDDLSCLKANSHSNLTKSRERPRNSSPTCPPQFSISPENIPTNENARMKTLKMCQPKRTKVLRQTTSCTAFPMKATKLPMPMENLEICGVSSAPQIKTQSQREHICGTLDDGVEEIRNEEEKCNDMGRSGQKKNTTACVLDKEIKVIKQPTQLKRNRSFTVNGLPDNYDPFLSAKRQLEELCSPSTESVDITTPATPQTPQLPNTPSTTPNSNNKMSTSLILSSSTPNTTPSPMTTSQITQKTPILTRSSSFRRTSSLRGPRRSPMLSTRPPLFAQKHRPTIQRGLSDEGPISTNFLKPEEYDEMPVRSVCVNDFAINKSPRVVRRDTSTLNRKQPLKLNINAANGQQNSSSATISPSVMEPEVVNGINTASKYVSKTDSLAVFLKFEHELEKLNSTAADNEHKKDNLLDVKTPPSTASPLTTPPINLDGPLNAKELKDKSNNLSKQNSAKNIKADILASSDCTENYDINLNTNSQLNTNDVETGKYGPVRLAPLATKPNTPQLMQTQTTIPQLTPLNVKNALSHNQEQKALKSPKPVKPVALSSIFSSDDSKNTKLTPLLYSERKCPIGSDYIDPKLINKCDNLPINLNLKRTDFKHSDSDTSEARLEHFSSSSSESSAPAKKTTSQAQHAKFLPIVRQQQPLQQQQQQQQQQKQEQHEQHINLNVNNHLPHQLPLSVTNSQRNSVESRNLLKRRMRLGRNQFLYDASPEGDSCSADDEGANRSSMEGDTAQQQCNSLRECEKAFERFSSAQANPIDAPFIPPLPAFDDFDFEEFLSSFENDEEQFPLFKDCREFLMNRTSKKQRSMVMPNSTTQNTNAPHNSTNMKKSTSPQTFPPLTPQSHSNAGQHFQFPSLSQHPKNLFNSFSFNTRARNKFDELTATKSTDTFSVGSHTEEYKDIDSQSLNQKREIFISIETEQNDLDKSPISPDSIRNMIGNPQTVVEVEVDAAHDNKFSKISDDDDADNSQNNCRTKTFSGHLAADEHRLPNVQLNNAKNLMQKMQEDFHQMGEEMSGNLRLSLEQKTAPLDVNMNTNLNMTGNMRNNMVKMNRAPGTPSGDAYGDSDELSSLDGYPLSSPNSRLGVSSKTSADSAYGSLSRQRSSELTSQRNSSRNRNINCNTANTLLNRPLAEETPLGRSRQLSASSSSSSEHALPPITSSNCYKKQQHLYNNNNNNNNIANDLDELMRYELNNNNSNSNSNSNNNNNYEIQQTHANLTGASDSHSNLESLQQFTSNSTMSTSMKMSKFCHECGSKFLVEQAKFCMDCGVKRIVL